LKTAFNFQLVKPAINMGGDRYVTNMKNKPWTVYFPQEISRPSGRPVHDITVRIDVGGIDPEDQED